MSCVGVIQRKLTVNATDESYCKALQSLAQAEEETRSKGAIVIKPGGRYLGTTSHTHTHGHTRTHKKFMESLPSQR